MKTVIEQIGQSFHTAQGHCQIHGEFESPVMNRESAPGTPQCPQCARLEIQKVGERQLQAQMQQHRAAQQQARIERIGIPQRLLLKTFDDYQPVSEQAAKHVETCRNYATQWTETAELGANLILCGKPGTGKTHLVSVICKQVAAENEAQPTYTTASQMLRHIRSSYGQGAMYSEAEAMDKFISPDLLAVDEVGAKLASEHDRAMLFEIIDECYQLRAPTIITSNLNIDEISKQTDHRLVDRLRENGSLMIFDWESYRGKVVT